MTSQIDPQILQKAVHKLAQGVAHYENNRSDEYARDALIQRFEFTYELACKSLRRFLASISDAPNSFHNAEFATVIRTACDQDLLLGTWADWKKYRELRSKTSHTYDEKIALAVVAEIPKFLTEMHYLSEKLNQRVMEKDAGRTNEL